MSDLNKVQRDVEFFDFFLSGQISYGPRILNSDYQKQGTAC